MDDSLVTALRRARRVVALTGAGISAESGVPTFRGPDGLWQSFRVEDLATPEAFARDPDLVWRWYRWRRDQIAAARPNAGHEALARLADRGPEFRLLTQNVDGLHQRAGSRDVVELHGNLWRSRCTREPGRRFEDFGAPREDDGLPRCPCGALRRPDVVWFGELLDREALEAAFDAAASCDVLLVVGTSAVVYPVAAIPEAARAAGARIVEINVQDTPLTAFAHHAIRQPAAVALPAIEEAW